LANPNKRARPLSPHVFHYKWGPHMLVSIVHRATGSGMATVGTLLLLWWLAALGAGESGYAAFRTWFATDKGLNPLGWILGVGLTLAFFQHLASGVRHLFLDEGALFELKRNKLTAQLTMVFSILATAGFWFVIWSKVHG
jgi:succinate dehydrogenase / fumarate reductase cytochrome b subunit